MGLGMVGLSTKRLKQAAQIAYEAETAYTIRLNVVFEAGPVGSSFIMSQIAMSVHAL